MANRIVQHALDRPALPVPVTYADQADDTYAELLATVAGGAGDRIVNGALDRQGIPVAERYADQGDGTYARLVALVGGGGGGGAAAAGTLTGATLAANVLASSLTSVGVLAAPHMTSPVVNSGGLSVTGTVTATAFSGPLTGNVTGNVSGSAATATLAAAAAALATPRAINGTNFDGSAAITVTAAAGTLTGATLAANVLASSLTSVGVLATLTVTATITGSVSGNAATATALATSRTINGIGFDGTANITVTAAAGTLTGATLAANVLASSLTSVGVLASPHVTSPVVDSGGLTVTGPNTLTGTATVGGATLLTLSPAAHTAVTAENNAILVNAQTITITGGYSLQRFALFSQPTITAASALTAGTAATLAIANAPTPAGSALITRPLALLVQNGQVGIDSNSGLSTATTANVGPALAITGTWITGGSATTTKPHVLIEPSGTTSTAWRTAGTGLGINAPSGFTGDVILAQINGVDLLRLQGGGALTVVNNVICTGIAVNANAALNGSATSSPLTMTQVVGTSGNRVLLTATGAAHTGQAIAEETDVLWNLSATATFTAAGSAIAQQRTYRIQARTYAAASGSQSLTAAATESISGPPIAGTNVVIGVGQAWPLWVGDAYATVAGGAPLIALGATTSKPTFGLYGGSGAPTIAAPKGSLYLRSDGSTTNDRAYINTDASTTWTPLTTGA